MTAIRTAKRAIPFIFSLILLAWVIWRVSPHSLAVAAAKVNWQLLVPATLLMVVALYLWDAVCLPAVYRVGDHRISYGQALHLRGLSYFGGALNYELGQAVLAWGMARVQQTGLVRMLARSVLLAYHDIVVLLVVGLAGSWLTSDPRGAIAPIYTGGASGFPRSRFDRMAFAGESKGPLPLGGCRLAPGRLERRPLCASAAAAVRLLCDLGRVCCSSACHLPLASRPQGRRQHGADCAVGRRAAELRRPGHARDDIAARSGTWRAECDAARDEPVLVGRHVDRTFSDCAWPPGPASMERLSTGGVWE